MHVLVFCFSGRNLGALFEVLCVGLSIMNLKLFGVILHYYRMVQMRHYDQRPFNETVWDAIIANCGVKNPLKRCKPFAMTDASNTVQNLVACALQGIRFISINYLG